MNTAIFMVLIGLIMIGWAFIYQTDSGVRSGKYVSRKSTLAHFMIDTPGSALSFNPPIPPDGFEPGDTVRLVIRRNYLVSDLREVPDGPNPHS